jgi:hypothetical protein
MSILEIAKIQVRRGQELQTGVPRLDPGEFGWAEDTEHLYIGKRIVEGANSDENSRILTESDLNNIFSLLGANNTLTLTTLYRYRDGIFPNFHTPTRIVQSKLDDYVGLTDFGVATSSTATDITLNFRHAVADLFDGDENNRRQLRIPAGNYIVTATITLPSYTTIIGEGSGLTKLILTSPTNSMFESEVQNGVGSNHITLSGMTLEYAKNLNSNAALLSLDRVSNVKIEDVRFTTSSTFTMTNFGIGISVSGIGDGIVERCEDIYIDNCEFSSIGIGILGTGTVLHPVISNSVFNNLQQGIKFDSGRNNDLLNPRPAPLDGVIISNRFEKIIREGIFVGTSSNRTNHVSENNIFREVGTGPDANGNPRSDETSSIAYSVITFTGSGNRSINDHFERQVKAADVSKVFYYNPLVKGLATITNGAIYTATIVVSSNDQKIVKIPLTGEDQKVTVEYSMRDSNYSRKGMLIANITSGKDGKEVYGSTYDHYDYSFEDPVTDPTFNIDYASSNVNNYNYVTLTCFNDNTSTYKISYQISFLS